MNFYVTKKQKTLMRERRRKRKKQDQEESTSDSKTRKRADSQDSSSSQNRDSIEPPTVVDPSQPITVIIPSNLRGKEARKFRKEERRKARLEGRDENLLNFVGKDDSGGQEQTAKKSSPTSLPSKKKKKSFPRINDLLEEQKQAQVAKKQEEARKQAEAKLPEETKEKYIALDCEMVGIGTDGKQSALARASLVDWYGKVLLDTYVKVPSRVTDFRTHVSGITPKHISSRSDNAMELHECRKQVGQLLRQKILVGHALQNDLRALMLNHPKVSIRDTAKHRPFQRASGRNGGKWKPRKLRDLVKEHLNQDIQVEGQAHDSTEDARATMELFKLVRDAWERELENKSRGKKQKRK